jgi:hypothetical protein
MERKTPRRPSPGWPQPLPVCSRTFMISSGTYVPFQDMTRSDAMNFTKDVIPIAFWTGFLLLAAITNLAA